MPSRESQSVDLWRASITSNERGCVRRRKGKTGKENAGERFVGASLPVTGRRSNQTELPPRDRFLSKAQSLAPPGLPTGQGLLEVLRESKYSKTRRILQEHSVLPTFLLKPLLNAREAGSGYIAKGPKSIRPSALSATPTGIRFSRLPVLTSGEHEVA